MTIECMKIAGALIVAAIGAATDVKTHLIPNKLTYLAMLVAIVGRFALEGPRGLGGALAGALLAGGVLIPLFVIHAMGAGDIKLSAAVGAFVGPVMAIEFVLVSAIAGGILAAIYALSHRRFRSALANVGSLIKFHAVAGAEVHPTLNLSNADAARMPYGPAILAGILYSATVLYVRGGL